MSTVVRANQSVKKGDLVKILSGKEKGKTGKVLRILSSANRAVVEHLNLVKRHEKPSQTNRQGGITQREAGIHLSNIAVVTKGSAVKTKAAPKQEASAKEAAPKKAAAKKSGSSEKAKTKKEAK